MSQGKVQLIQSSSSKEIFLRPFPGMALADVCQVTAKVAKSPEGLCVSFELHARLDTIVISPFDRSTSTRKDNLWEHTCFEIFIGSKDNESYREFNLSPSGAWNVYSFKGYREGMETEPAIASLSFDVRIIPERGLDLTVEIDSGLAQITADTLIGISAVIEHSSGIKSYWAIYHPKAFLDFHAKKSWVNL
jgi:hypothetical protein